MVLPSAVKLSPDKENGVPIPSQWCFYCSRGDAALRVLRGPRAWSGFEAAHKGLSPTSAAAGCSCWVPAIPEELRAQS